MPLATIEFRPKARNAESARILSDRVSWYSTLLYRNGQVASSSVCEWVGPTLRLVMSATSPAALRPRAFSDHAREELKDIAKLCSSPPRCETGPSGQFDEVMVSLKRAPSLYVRAPHYESDSVFALRDGKTGVAVPIFDLPMSDHDREQVVLWGNQSRAFYSVWMYSGALEMQAWQEHAAARSSTNRIGRELAAAIECATGKPTYLEIFRYYRFTDEREANRVCPGCGRRWKRPSSSGAGLLSFHFRCDRCRLVQDRGSGDRNARAAMIGEWRGGKALPSAGELRRGVRSGKVRL